MGITLRATLALFLQSSDSELVSKISALASARRASLQALGLERVAKELDLAEYLKRKAEENRSDDTNGDTPDTSPADAEQAASRGDEGGEPEAVTRSAPPSVVLNGSGDSQGVSVAGSDAKQGSADHA